MLSREKMAPNHKLPKAFLTTHKPATQAMTNIRMPWKTLVHPIALIPPA